MAGRKKYMEYLSDPTAPLPKSTKYRRFAWSEELNTGKNVNNNTRQPDFQYEMFDTHCDEVHTFEDSAKYEDMFNYQQKIAEMCPLEDSDNYTETNVNDETMIELESLNNVAAENVRINEIDTDSSIEFDDEKPKENAFKESVHQSSSLTFHDLAVLLITLKTSFNLSSIALSFVIKIISLVLPTERRGVLKNLNQLYAYFHTRELHMKKHYYCGNCEFYLGIEKIKCPSCGKEHKPETYFVEMPLEAELQKILKRNWKHLDYRFDRPGANTNTISDVYDGTLYKKHFREGGFLYERNNVSLLGNTDGVSIFKSSSFSVWPVYVVINELPPKLRFRRENRILCGLWIGHCKPNFSTFFKPFTETIWKLCTEGFEVRVTNNDKSQICKAILLQMTCDSPAKCLFQGFMQYNAYYGCPYCLNPGEFDRIGRSHVYLYKNDSVNGFGQSRTHEGTVEHARTARANLEEGKRKFAEKGVKGMSWAFSLPSFDIIDSMCLDYMHAVLLGVTKQLLNYWCSNEAFSLSKENYAAVQSRLIDIPPPNNITRAPRSLDERKHWKASEYRSFLLFYGPVCLYKALGQMYYDHFMLLSSAVWLLLQETITQEDLEEATRHLRYFSYQMSDLYGTKAMTFSMHLLLHLPNSVVTNGPLWSHSCFYFEDYNGELRQFFHSSQHPESQVVRAVSVIQELPEMVQEMDPESPAGILQRQMTADRYKVKCLTECGVGLALVGKEENTVPSESLKNEAYKLHGAHFDGNIKIFKRALVRGHMMHSELYTKVKQRNSYTVQYDENKYGEVLLYVILDQSPYAFLRPFTEIDTSLCKDNLTGKLGKHITLITDCSEPTLVPLNKVNQKVIIMKLAELAACVVTRFPNFIERD